MSRAIKRARTVALPRPKGTRLRVALMLTMHPSELARLEQRAAAASMSVTAYVAALLASDAEDVPGATRRRSIWADLTTGEPEPLLVARRAAADRYVAGLHSAGFPAGDDCACSYCREQREAKVGG